MVFFVILQEERKGPIPLGWEGEDGEPGEPLVPRACPALALLTPPSPPKGLSYSHIVVAEEVKG